MFWNLPESGAKLSISSSGVKSSLLRFMVVRFPFDLAHTKTFNHELLKKG